MKPDLINKIREELLQPIASERQVVYLLVECRKLLEMEGVLDRYSRCVSAWIGLFIRFSIAKTRKRSLLISMRMRWNIGDRVSRCTSLDWES